MNKLVVLSFGSGDLQTGFDSVAVRLWESGKRHSMQFTGNLPAAPEISQLYKQWQMLYSAVYDHLKLNIRVKLNTSESVNNFSEIDLSDLCQKLVNRINTWLNSESFYNIDQQLRTYLERSDEIQVIIETNDNLLRRLPWHLCDFFKDYPLAEAALSASDYKKAYKVPNKIPNEKVSILAVFGNSKGIDIQKDRLFLEQLSDKAETEFLVEPPQKELIEKLWKSRDIFFFAGHSYSNEKGVIQLNQTDNLTLDKLKYTLEKAISSGLKLAIFNSCDGLGLAQALFDLHIPQVIVMREPVPDVVAQEFLRHFLTAFSSGQSLYASVREARKKLEALEKEYPCASWLPVICQNPAEASTTWQELCAPAPVSGDSLLGTGDFHTGRFKQNSRQKQLAKRRALGAVLLASMAVTAVVMGVRYLGMLQNWELQAFDQLVRLRPDEKPDPRILLITISENDIRSQNPNLRRGSISDWALNKVLKVLEENQVRAIGLDIYRDFPTSRDDLAQRFKSDRFVAVCKVRDISSGDAGTPPPPEVPVESQGFSDSLEDSDGVIRRYLFYMTPDPASPCVAPYAFSMQVAFRYLAAQGILPKATAEDFLQLGNVIFRPLEAHAGGYQGIDAWSHQTLLNYRSPRGPQNVAAQISLMQLLRGQFDPSWVKDRVVLIGTTASSFQDFWHTPYSNNQQSARQLPGVLVQAQMVSQILSAVLDNRPLLWAWPLWAEVLWVLGWSLIAGILAAWRWRSPLHLGVAIVAVMVCLYGLSLILLSEIGCWVPLVPSALALIVTSGSVATYNTTGYLRQLVLKSS